MTANAQTPLTLSDVTNQFKELFRNTLGVGILSIKDFPNSHNVHVYCEKDAHQYHSIISRAIAKTGIKYTMLTPSELRSDKFFEIDIEDITQEELDRLKDEIKRQFHISNDFDYIKCESSLKDNNDPSVHDLSYGRISSLEETLHEAEATQRYVRVPPITKKMRPVMEKIRLAIQEALPSELFDGLSNEEQKHVEAFRRSFNKLEKKLTPIYPASAKTEAEAEAIFTKRLQAKRNATGFESLQELAEASLKDPTFEERTKFDQARLDNGAKFPGKR